jgi:beta-mannosidase
MKRWAILAAVIGIMTVQSDVESAVGSPASSLNGTWSYIADPSGEVTVGEVVSRFRAGALSEMPVPSNWTRCDTELRNYHGVVWFIRRLDVADLKPAERLLLSFEGVDYFADVFWNGLPIGAHAGYFEPFRFDVTEAVHAGENLLAVRVNCPRDTGYPDRKTLIKGIFTHHDCRPGSNSGTENQVEPTGGIWGNVALERTGPVTIDEALIHSVLENGKGRVIARYRVQNRSDAERRVRLSCEIKGKTFRSRAQRAHRDLVLAPGATEEVRLEFMVANPRLWWTWNHGRPDLYTATAAATVGREESSRRADDFGIRSIEFDSVTHVMKLNGRRVFHKGSNHIPTQWLAEYTEAMHRRDIRRMKEGNMNAMRVHSHILPHLFYRLCDEEGILVWSDFPLIWGYDTGMPFAAEARRQYKAAIEGWYNHPSIWIWSAHNEGSHNDPLNIELTDWGRRLDPTRVHLKNSGKWPPGPGGWDEHLYFGWYNGNYLEFAGRADDKMITEYGAQALPNNAAEFLGTQWPPDLERWRYHNFQLGMTVQNLGPLELSSDFHDFRLLSQAYQYDLVRFATEAYRRHQWNSATGLYHFMFKECWPSVTWAVVDVNDDPKPAFYGLRDAYKPAIVSLETSRRNLDPGEEIDVPVWVVSDLRAAQRGWKVRYGIEGKRASVLRVTVAPDSSRVVANLRVSAPRDADTSIRVFAELLNSRGVIQSRTEWEFHTGADAWQLGEWTFRTGDDLAWAAADRNPEGFTPIKVPGAWEENGVPGHDGFGWFRAGFRVPDEHAGPAMLVIGAIDDADEVYVNGEKIGATGSLPPNYETAWNVERRYVIPERLLRRDRTNVLAVRVYDAMLGGGITKGPVRISRPEGIALDELDWKFREGDVVGGEAAALDDASWQSVRVPSSWTNDAATFGWYRVRFDVPAGAHLAAPLGLMIGGIRDVDAAWLNGRKIGQTGEFPPAVAGGEVSGVNRTYVIPAELLTPMGNVLAIRVYRANGSGGIARGPVRIAPLDRSLRYRPILARYPEPPRH